MDLEDTFGWIGCFLNTCFFLVELIPFINIIRGKVYFEDSPGFFMSASYANSFLWSIYGDLVFSEQIKTTNMIGCLICFIALMIYLSYERKKYLLDSILNFLMIFMVSWAVFKYLSIEVDDDRVVGKLCFCSSCIIYMHFYYIIYRVVKEKNYMLIPFNHITIYFVNSIIWIFYGIVTNDFYVILPNSMGTLLSLIQVLLKMILPLMKIMEMKRIKKKIKKIKLTKKIKTIIMIKMIKMKKKIIKSKMKMKIHLRIFQSLLKLLVKMIIKCHKKIIIFIKLLKLIIYKLINLLNFD